MKFLLVTALVSVSAYAADDPFLGTWKMNSNNDAGQVIEIKDLGGNRYDWVYNTKHTEYIADGKEHPVLGGMLSLSQESPDQWVITARKNGQVVQVLRLTLADGGQLLKEERKATRPDGSAYSDGGEFTRIGSGSGFAGTWEVKNAHESSFLVVIKPYGEDGLAFWYPADKWHLDLKLDGKDYADPRPAEKPGRTKSGKRIDGYTIELTDKLDGKVTGTDEWKVSPDGKTLTITGHETEQKKPTVTVFDKQM
jgi:hypothetical protein